MMSLKGDINNNGKIDNNKEERANIEYNANDIKGLQTELNKLKRKINVGVINNRSNEFASSAKVAEELSDGKQKIYFNNVNKSVVMKYGNKQMSSCLQIGTNDNSLKNVSHVHFESGSTFKGLINTLAELYHLPFDELDHYAPSISFVQTFYQPDFDSIRQMIGIIGNDIWDRTTAVRGLG